ncbi:hypothetical protein EHI8A_040980 [Entamoeba histolytica HM-1:IMSS-B]|uniref:Long chain 3-ketoacyl-CoA thiolase n=6 Tax=Entamoeba histolytica TaxID=5759 RepID=C4M306_ENTH1|nr:hypothetical protein EHI_074170 [Entamoeba histolytica HM-1:IMSS]EMD46358.1 long chain 3ketoacyl-CoA thiolase, putative [Entamoeba histolytica KU27]EMH77779.1 hypothetical protein EHI8A_040980 [Entamoeba histolytica HM-1:IMSS-B]EMS13055.1 long chain 3-ketoacyl-CoA thiolase [Entamoeba histolytica HM-3:IMSS]ENY64902.1 long chain 3-ketoacyl-CoA thiolase, putative [Entamoeba histolytica HM-1:IMSS-A]GAT95680.1 hypothetical protein CL6EHI_074170 [Entamoeba histolytica]|eukprot:XP_653558.2 hypothetical protein EHI_074170 [Entamoeba histolytica HM-1:IMSS]
MSEFTSHKQSKDTISGMFDLTTDTDFAIKVPRKQSISTDKTIITSSITKVEKKAPLIVKTGKAFKYENGTPINQGNVAIAVIDEEQVFSLILYKTGNVIITKSVIYTNFPIVIQENRFWYFKDSQGVGWNIKFKTDMDRLQLSIKVLECLSLNCHHGVILKTSTDKESEETFNEKLKIKYKLCSIEKEFSLGDEEVMEIEMTSPIGVLLKSIKFTENTTAIIVGTPENLELIKHTGTQLICICIEKIERSESKEKDLTVEFIGKSELLEQSESTENKSTKTVLERVSSIGKPLAGLTPTVIDKTLKESKEVTDEGCNENEEMKQSNNENVQKNNHPQKTQEEWKEISQQLQSMSEMIKRLNTRLEGKEGDVVGMVLKLKEEKDEMEQKVKETVLENEKLKKELDEAKKEVENSKKVNEQLSSELNELKNKQEGVSKEKIIQLIEEEKKKEVDITSLFEQIRTECDTGMKRVMQKVYADTVIGIEDFDNMDEVQNVLRSVIKETTINGIQEVFKQIEEIQPKETINLDNIIKSIQLESESVDNQ